MTTPAQRRLIKDLEKINKEGAEDFMAAPLDDNIMIWSATIEGPQGTPWEGGLFTLKLQFSESYPNSPPRVKFLSKMFHPNIYNDGRICLDMLYNQWSPVYDVWALLTAIKSLLLDPNTQSPANMVASNIFKENKSLYEIKVREAVEKSLEELQNEDQILRQLKQEQIEKPPPEPLPKPKDQEKFQRKRPSLSMNSLAHLSSVRPPARLWSSAGAVIRWQSSENLVGLNPRFLHIEDPAQNQQESHSSHSSRKPLENDDSDNDEYEEYLPEEGENQSEGPHQQNQQQQGQNDEGQDQDNEKNQRNEEIVLYQGGEGHSQNEGQQNKQRIEGDDNHSNAQNEENHEYNIEQPENSEGEPRLAQQEEGNGEYQENNNQRSEQDSQQDGTGIGDGRSRYENEPREEPEVVDQEIQPNEQ